jgi:DNA topoisomerase-1
MTITLDESIALIEEKRKQELEKHIKNFPNDTKLEVLKGRFGPYLNYNGTNYRLPKSMHERAVDLTYDECMKVIASVPARKKK